MKWQGSDKKMMMGLTVVLGILLVGGGTAEADIIMGEPSSVGPVINDATDVQNSDFSHDGLELYYSSARPGGYGRKDIWVARRETLNSPWQEPVNLGPSVNSPEHELEPSISSDGLTLYFTSWDDFILRVCTRPSKDAAWSTPTKLASPIGLHASSPDISTDGLSLYVASAGNGGYGNFDLWVATRATTGDPWGDPVNLGPHVNTSGDEWALSISADGLTLVFTRGFRSMWATTRKSIDDDWGPAVLLPFNNPPGNFHSPTLSPDGSTLYFNAAEAWGTLGANDIWQVQFIPIVDFNGDAIVDAADMSMMTADWHTHRPLCDIAPLPMGDNYVDLKDLLLLTDYLEPGDPTMIAHWTFDEAEGIVARDSAGVGHGTVVGTALWQPEAGNIKGALELEGSTFVAVDPFLSPSDGPFSVLAWVKSSTPGQVIVSQASGENWICTDPMNGCLMTELKGTGRHSNALCSDATITDGSWHRIGLVYDGDDRSLYVDDILVAADTQAGGPADCWGGLNIGCGKDMAWDSFFSGLIDDIRIYNRAVRP